MLDLERKVKDYMLQIPPHHGYPHVVRVATCAKKIGRRIGFQGCEIDKLEIAALLHDLGRVPEMEQLGHAAVKTNHSVLSAELAPTYLKSIIFLAYTEQNLIVQAIAEHSQPEPASTPLGRILQDADRLSRFSWQGVIDCICCFTDLNPKLVREHMKSGEKLAVPKDVRELLVTRLQWTVDWFDMLNTPEARQIALPGWAAYVGYSTRIGQVLIDG